MIYYTILHYTILYRKSCLGRAQPDRKAAAAAHPEPHDSRCRWVWAALLVQRYLSNTASSVECFVRCVKDEHNLPICSPRLKTTCVLTSSVRQAAPPE